MSSVEIRAPQPQELEAMYQQRWLVLRQPLGKPFGSERDRADEAQGSYYAIALGDNQVIGSARLRLFDGGIATIAYVAVLTDYARQGIGTGLMKYLLHVAQQKQWHKVRLRSRVTAQGFYEKLGFRATTDPFLHIGLPHVDMELDLPSETLVQ